MSRLSRLSRLSDSELHTNLTRLVKKERRRVVDILEHLNEVERRKLHLEMGFRSLFAYCETHLRLSASVAGRRIAAARALKEFPEIGAMLRSGEVNVTTLSLVASLLTPATKDDLLDRIRGKSQREVEKIAAEYRPRRAAPDRIRPVMIAAPAAPAQGTSGTLELSERNGNGKTAPGGPAAGDSPGELGRDSGKSEAVDAGTKECGAAGHGRAADSAATARGVQKHELKFLAGEAFMQKLERMRILLSTRGTHATLEQTFDAAMEAYLERHCPIRRNGRRRESRKQAKRAARGTRGGEATQHTAKTRNEVPGEDATQHAAKPRAGMCRNDARQHTAGMCRKDARQHAAGPQAGVNGSRSLPAQGVNDRRSRHIPSAVRDGVFERDGGRCSYVAPDGRRCDATRDLQIDHVTPFALGGTHHPSNLQLLCRAHNRLAAEHVFGRENISAYSRSE